MIAALSPSEAKARLHAGGEIAFLDVREAGQFGEGHPLFAVPCPYSRLELMVGALVPRGDAPVLLIDQGDGVAEKAAKRLGGARLQRCEHRRRRRARLGGGRPDALQGRQRALQDARRTGRGCLAPGDPGCRDLAELAPRRAGFLLLRRPARGGIREDARARGGLSSQRRARPPLPRRRPGRRHARACQLRRTHPRHRRGDRPEARRHPQPGLRTGERHAGLGARRGGAAARRPGGALSRAFRSRDGGEPPPRRGHLRAMAHPADRYGDAASAPGASVAARRISSTCARRRNFPPATCPAPCTRRAARSSRRRINGSASGAPASCSSTIRACGPRWPRSGCGSWAGRPVFSGWKAETS